MYDEAGALAWQAQLDIYGVARASVGAKGDCPFRWPGQYEDEDEDEETGLYYNRFRYYAPERGGYLSKDPIGLRGGLEPYGYCVKTRRVTAVIAYRAGAAPQYGARDSLGRVTRLAIPGVGAEELAYDPMGNIISIRYVDGTELEAVE